MTSFESAISQTRVVADRTPSSVYVGRAGQGEDGTFGNPCRVGETCPQCKAVHLTPRSTLRCFKEYFEERVATDLKFRLRVLELYGRALWCPGRCTAKTPGECHAVIIAVWLNGQRVCTVCKKPPSRFMQTREGSFLLCATCEPPSAAPTAAPRFKLPPLPPRKGR